MRTACGLALFLAAWAGGPARADEKSPPPPRFLSLAEARALALEKAAAGRAAGRGRVLAVSTATGPGVLVLVRGKSRTEAERQLSMTLLNVETAYWNLYGAYWQLFSREQGLRFVHEVHHRATLAYAAGRVKAADVAQARGQYELFRAQRLQTVQTVAENEKQLRELLGLPPLDGQRLVPSDAPTLTLFKPDWKRSLRMALAQRPEVRQARGDVLVGEAKLVLARAIARADGPLPNLVLRVSQREALANKRQSALILSRTFEDVLEELRRANDQAGLSLARSYGALHDMELKAERFLALQYTRLPAFYEQVRAHQAQREAFGEQVRSRQRDHLAGRGTLDILLEAQRFWADSVANEYQAVVSYNNALCAFEFARGNLLRHHNVSLAAAEPEGTKVRAAERERRRTVELARNTPALAPDTRVNPMWEAPKAGPAPLHGASLPALLKRVPLLTDPGPLPKP